MSKAILQISNYLIFVFYKRNIPDFKAIIRNVLFEYFNRLVVTDGYNILHEASNLSNIPFVYHYRERQ